MHENSQFGLRRTLSNVSAIFRQCVRAIRDGKLIEREGRRDKEFHFQNWFAQRLGEIGLDYDPPGRNTYPDFRLVKFAEGYELKALASPGRETSYDCNSQIPRGEHNGRQVYYVFGRYPADPDGDHWPVIDLVLCHGSFLNADNAYVHKNKSFRGFGSYGDILVRDRKMYVAPTPFALAEGTAHRHTLILPASQPVANDLRAIGNLTRSEDEEIIVAYSCNLLTNEIRSQTMPNPNAGQEHALRAYRVSGDSEEPARLREKGRKS